MNRTNIKRANEIDKEIKQLEKDIKYLEDAINGYHIPYLRIYKIWVGMECTANCEVDYHGNNPSKRNVVNDICSYIKKRFEEEKERLEKELEEM